MARFKIVKCPLCNGKLEIDLNSGKIYRHFEKMKGKEAVSAFDRFVDKVADRESASEDIFKEATEKAKDKDLDDIFRKAAERAKKDLEEGEK